jgi:hypothetical protein
MTQPYPLLGWVEMGRLLFGSDREGGSVMSTPLTGWAGRISSTDRVPAIPCDPAPGPASQQFSDNAPCDGTHPATSQPCTRQWHRGYHQAANGALWLDD